MLFIVLQALFFFLPAYAANAAPVLLCRAGWFDRLAVPVDFNHRLNGNPLFGRTKTWRGIFGGIAAAMFIVLLQTLIYYYFPAWRALFLLNYSLPFMLLPGLLLGAGEGLGDLIKSFFKRRLNIKSSAPFFPFDQLSFLGALILCSTVVKIPVEHVIVICVLSPLIPVLANIAAYKLGWKNVWW